MLMLWSRILVAGGALALILLPQKSDAFVPSRRRQLNGVAQEFAEAKLQSHKHSASRRNAPTMKMATNDGDEGPGIASESSQPGEEVDAFLLEQEASRRMRERLMFPGRVATSISKTITAMAWSFVIFGFVLNFVGYGYVMDKDGWRIDTLEASMFQREIVRSMRSEDK
jgi:hypothetical protein